MSDYAKILKCNEVGEFVVSLCLLDDLGRTGSYSRIMKENYEKGFTQVIINSSLMLQVTEAMLRENWILNFVSIEDPSVDEETKKTINYYVEEIKKNPLNFNKLKEYLNWALEDGSIFIDKIRMAKKIDNKFEAYELYSTGVLFGNIKQEVFEKYIKKIIEEYLNEG